MKESEYPRASGSSSEPPVLLVVEDDDADFLLLKRALYKVGATARVWWARTTEEALALVQQFETATCNVCVVMDVHLGGEETWGLMERIKAKAKSPRWKCVILTGSCDEPSRERAQRQGVNAFFVKPCDGAALAQIARALQQLACQ